MSLRLTPADADTDSPADGTNGNMPSRISPGMFGPGRR